MIHNVLTFSVDNNICAVEVASVLEVLNYSIPTAIPCAEHFIEGLIYSRNQGITVINLRKKFGIENRVIDKKTKIIVIEIPQKNNDEETKVLYGLLVDSVLDVSNINDENTIADLKTSIPQEYINKIIKTDLRTILLLNFDDF